MSEEKSCCAKFCESLVQVGAGLSVTVTIGGIVCAYLGKAPIIRALAGFGVSTAPETLDRFTDLFFLVVIGVSIWAMIPILYATPSCRQRVFGVPEEDPEGCCARCCQGCRRCIAGCFGTVVVGLTEVILFLVLCVCLAVSYGFLLGAAILIFFSDICQIGGTAPDLTQDLITALNNTEIGNFLTGISVNTFCNNPDNTTQILGDEGRLVVGGLFAAIIGQVMTFQATSKAKEGIQAELAQPRKSLVADDALQEEIQETEITEIS